jgi:hypothetical protein
LHTDGGFETDTVTTMQHNIFRLKITLLGAKPQIWRRLEIPTDYTFGDLHTAIQLLFDWEESHLHQFDVNGRKFAVVDDTFDETDAEDADEVLLTDLPLQKGSRFVYTYDFGDNWEHGIEVEGVAPRRKDVNYPRCTKAVRAGPPEDCGGVYGYARLLRIYKSLGHSEHEDVCEWLGEDFDPVRVNAEELTNDLVEVIGAE